MIPDFEDGFTEPVFSEHEIFVGDHRLGLGNEVFQNDPQNQHDPPEMHQEELETARQRLGCC